MNFKLLRQNTGFSLVELLFAIAFLSVIVFGVIRLQVSNLGLSNTQNLELQAHFWASQALEIVESIGSGTFTPDTTYEIDLSGVTYSLQETGAVDPILATTNDLFSRTVEITQPAAISPWYNVKVTVNWEDSTGTHQILANRIIE